MMRICLIGNARAVHLQRWATAYRDAGHDVEIVSIRSASIAGIPVHTVSVGPTNSPGRTWSLLSYVLLALTSRWVIARCDPDVVHAHFTITSGSIARAAGRRPIVTTAWGSDVIPADGLRQSRTLESINRWALGGADRVTVASAYLANWVTRISPSTDAEIVPFGVDTTAFRPRRSDPGGDRFSIGIVKSLEPRYGVEHAIRAMQHVTAEVPNAVLTIAGEGSLRSRLEELVADLGLEDTVEFVGRVEHRSVPDLLQSFDVLLNPTVVPESFGVVILEGSASGIPVVSSDVGGVREVCVDGETAVLVPAGDHMAIADAIVGLAGDPEKRRRFGIAGRDFVRSRFEWAQSVGFMLDVLMDTADRSR